MISSSFINAMAEKNTTTVHIATITALTEYVSKNKPHTQLELNTIFNQAEIDLLQYTSSPLAVQATIQLCHRIVSRLDSNNFVEGFVRFGNKFAERGVRARESLANHTLSFIPQNANILVHSYSRAVMSVLEKNLHLNFTCYISETRPDASCVAKITNQLKEWNVPYVIITDTAVGRYMTNMDICLVGAEVVLENGGIVNQLGTFQVAHLANAHKTPLYCCAESYKFFRYYPLTQDQANFTSAMTDYTPPNLISLIFTNMGIFTPPAVSDELIKIFC